MSIGELGRRLARLWRRDQEASQLAEEMRLHVELRTRRLEELGDDGARYAALRQFGNRAMLSDASASVWGWNWWERWLQDIRHGARGLMRSPGFTAVVIGTLAAGLGMNTAVFSMVDGVILRSLPYPTSDRLISLWEEQIKLNLAGFSSHGTQIGRNGGPRRTTVSVANIADYAKAQACSAIASYDLAPVNLTGTGSPERLQAEAVSAGFFEVLGIGPTIGRSFTTSDDRQQAVPVVIVTHEFWQRRLGGDTQVLGRDLLLDGVPYRIIGVMPAGFRSPLEIALPEAPPEVFLPSRYSKEMLTQRGNHDVNVVARLRPGVSLATARSELDAISAGLQKQYPATNSNIQAVVAPLADDLVRSVSGLLWILLGTSGLIVLITCVNVANLMLVRAVRRQQDSAVRMALGAGRGGLVRQCLAESMLLAAAGCIAGIGVGWAFLRILISIAPPGTPRLNDVAIDWGVFAVSAAIATATGVLFGIAPAWQASRALPAEALKTSARSTGTKSQARWRAALTTIELALSLVLLIGAGLLLRSFMEAMGVGLGFQTERVLAMNINLPQPRYPTAAQRFEYFRMLEQRVRSLPGVEAAAFANRMPLRGGWSTSVFVDSAPGVERVSDAQAVSAGYFETLGIPLLRGRAFTSEDRDGTMPAAIVNQEFARQYLDGRDPLGHEVQRGRLRCRIVGVVNDIRRGGKLEHVNPEIYFPAAQTQLYPVRLADFAVRAAGDPRLLMQAIQNQVWALDRDQPVTNVRTMQEIIVRSVAQNRFQMALLLAFAGVAVLLASIGIFGVLSFLVNQRMNELGIRIALGASPQGIVALVLRQAGAWVAAGIVIGIAGAALLTRYLETLLFQVKRTDPLTYAGAIGLLAAVAVAAAFLPARRGSRADPMHALRYE